MATLDLSPYVLIEGAEGHGHVADDGSNEVTWTAPDGAELAVVDVMPPTVQPAHLAATVDPKLVLRFARPVSGGEAFTATLGGRPTLSPIPGGAPSTVAGTWGDWWSGLCLAGGMNGGGDGDGYPVDVPGVGTLYVSGGCGASTVEVDGGEEIVAGGEGGAAVQLEYRAGSYVGAFGSDEAGPFTQGAVPGPGDDPRRPRQSVDFPSAPTMEAFQDGVAGGERDGADGVATPLLVTPPGESLAIPIIFPAAGGGAGWGGGASGASYHYGPTTVGLDFVDNWGNTGGFGGGTWWGADFTYYDEDAYLVQRVHDNGWYDEDRSWRWGFGSVAWSFYRRRRSGGWSVGVIKF